MNNVKIYKVFYYVDSYFTKKKQIQTKIVVKFKDVDGYYKLSLTDIKYIDNCFTINIRKDIISYNFYQKYELDLSYILKFLDVKKLNNNTYLIFKDFIYAEFTINIFKLIRKEKIKKLI